MKGSMKKGDLANLQVEMVESMEKNMGNMEKKLETNMGNMEKKLEESMEIIEIGRAHV